MSEVFKVLLSIKNSCISKHDSVEVKIKNNPIRVFKILRILYEEGFILSYIYDKRLNTINIKNNVYRNKCMLNVLKIFNKVSYPVYLKYTDLCAIHKFGVDLLILSTDIGFIPHYQAMKLKKGGKLICYIR